MRSTVALGLAAVLGTALLAPSGAEADGRRRLRPVGIGATTSALVRSDDALRALLAATPAGGTLRLPAGAFRTGLVIDRPMTIVGGATGTTLDATDLGRPALEILPGVRDVAIEAVRVVGASGDGILAGGANARLRLVRVAVSGSGAAGLRVLASDDVTIEASTFERNGGPGVDLDGARARLLRCALRSNGIAGARLRGVDAGVRECELDGGTDGLLVEGARGDVFRCSFRGLGVGVRIARGSEGTRVSRCDGRGLLSLVVAEAGSASAYVVENRLSDATGDGIRVEGAWHRVEGNVIRGARGAGVDAAGAGAAVLRNVVERAGAEGVRASGGGCVVDGNEVVAPAGTAIEVRGDGVSVTANVVMGAGAEGLRATGDRAALVGNRVEDAKGAGVALDGDLGTAQGNTVRRCGAGVRVVAGFGNRVEANSCEGCLGPDLVDDGRATTLGGVRAP